MRCQKKFWLYLFIIILILFSVNYEKFGISYLIWNLVIHGLILLFIFGSIYYATFLNIKAKKILISGYYILLVTESFYLLSLNISKYNFLITNPVLALLGFVAILIIMYGFKEIKNV